MMKIFKILKGLFFPGLLFLLIFGVFFSCEQQSPTREKEHVLTDIDYDKVAGVYFIIPSSNGAWIQLDNEGHARYHPKKDAPARSGVFTLRSGMLRIYIDSVKPGPMGVFSYSVDETGNFQLRRRGLWKGSVKVLSPMASSENIP